MNTILILLCLGLFAGVLSGMVGVGGGFIIVPALVFLVGFNQHTAQGTVLFMFTMPFGILGVYNYYKEGYVNWQTAFIIGSTFIIGSFFGSKIAIAMDQNVIKKIFGSIIFLISLKMLFGK